MQEHLGLFINIWVKFYFLATPFFAVTMFLALTKGYADSERRKLVGQITLAIGVLVLGMFFFGSLVFKLFGITLDAFRVGGGILLFLSAVQLTQSNTNEPSVNEDEDIVVVPMAMPIIIGPATIGAIMIFGADLSSGAEKGIGSLALICAVLSIGLTLLLASSIKRLLGKKGLKVLSKVTGLILAAISAQMVFVGIRNAFSIPSP